MKNNIPSNKIITPSEQKKILLELLKEFDSFCQKNNIRYYLIGGTLLGAVRHSGFIPWDDDVDVCMFREDYDRFLAEYKPSGEKYTLKSLELDKKYLYPFAKLVDNETILIESKNDKNGLGVYLDIFPIDNCPGNKIEDAYKNIDKINIFRWLRNFKIIEFSKKRSLLKNIVLALGKIICFPISRRRIAELIAKKASANKNIKCQFVGELVNTAYGYGEVYDRCHFGEGSKLSFEGYEFMVPIDYDYILTSMYGDYMKLPPIEKRVSNHNSICWYKSNFNQGVDCDDDL